MSHFYQSIVTQIKCKAFNFLLVSRLCVAFIYKLDTLFASMDAKNSCISTLPVLIQLMLSAFFIHSSAAVAIECQPLKFVPSTYSFSEDDDPYQDIPNVALKCTISETQGRISVDLFSDDILKPYPYFDNQTMECHPNKMCDLDIYFECNNTQTRMGK